MSIFQLVHQDMKEAENAATEAADGARGHGSGRYVQQASGAIRGASSVDWLGELETSWEDEIELWANRTETFGTQILATSDDGRGTDDEADGLFSGIFGRVGSN